MNYLNSRLAFKDNNIRQYYLNLQINIPSNLVK